MLDRPSDNNIHHNCDNTFVGFLTSRLRKHRFRILRLVSNFDHFVPTDDLSTRCLASHTACGYAATKVREESQSSYLDALLEGYTHGHNAIYLTSLPNFLTDPVPLLYSKRCSYWTNAYAIDTSFVTWMVEFRNAILNDINKEWNEQVLVKK